MMISADFAILGATIITMDGTRRVISNGGLAVKEDRIVWVGAENDCLAAVDAQKIIRADGDVICPGFINGHVHTTGDPLTRHYMPDHLGGPDKLATWVIPRYIAHTEEDEQLSAKYCAVELMKAGTTTFVEAGTIRHLDHAIEGFREAGIRGRVGAWVEGRSYDDETNAARLADEAIKILEDETNRYPNDENELIVAWPILVGHNTNPDEVWRAAKKIADENGLSISAHMSPYQADPDWYLSETGHRPVEHLDSLGVLGPNLLLTHMTHVDANETALVGESGTNVVYCPFAALKGAFGVSRHGYYTEFLRRGIKIAFATDGYDAELLQATRVGAAFFKDLESDTTTISAMQALELITCGAAEAVGLESQIGSLETGKKADFIWFDTNNSQWRPLLSPVAQLLWSASSQTIKHVWVDGNLVVDNGRHSTIDEDILLQDVQKAAEAIIERAKLPA